MDTGLYLARIGFEGPVVPTLSCLERLVAAHLGAVPFENFDIHLGVPLRLDEDSLFRKIVLRRRGGFCYELNGLFAGLLRSLGFEVDLLSARIVRSDSVGPAFDHLALRVVCEGTSYLVDVGFGDGSTLPIAMRAGASRLDHGNHFGLRASGDDLCFEMEACDGAVKGYQFSLRAHKIEAFYPMSRYHQSSARSWFTRARICVKRNPTGTVSSLIDGTLKRNGHVVAHITNRGDYLTTLRDEFSVDLPRLPANKSESVEQRIRKQGLIWSHRARRAIEFAGQLSPIS